MSEKGLIVTYNRIVGGIQMRQERSSRGGCRIAPALADLWNYTCLQNEADKWYDLEPDRIEGITTVNPDEDKTIWFWTHMSPERMETQMMNMEVAEWADAQTTKLEIGIPIYNAEHGVHTLVTVNFYFSRGGHIWKQIISQSCWAEWHPRWMMWVWDIAFALAILYILFCEFTEVVGVVASSGVLAIFTEYMTFYNFIDWLAVSTGVTAVVIMVECAFFVTPGLNEAAQAVGNFQNSGLFTWELNDLPIVRTYMDELRMAVELVTLLQTVMTFYPIIICFRLFKAFHAQQRLAVVTKTMQVAFVDLSHFLLVFLCVFLSFATSGMVLFGRDMVEFADFTRAFMGCFRLLLGDIDFDTMKDAGRDVASLWLLLFMPLTVLLLLNMLLAIIMDSYTAVKTGAGNSPSLITEIVNMVKSAMDSSDDKPVPLEICMLALADSEISGKSHEVILKAGKRQKWKSKHRDDFEEEDDAYRMADPITGELISHRLPTGDPVFDTAIGINQTAMPEELEGAPKNPSAVKWKEQREEAIGGHKDAWERELIFIPDLIHLVKKAALNGRRKRRYNMSWEQAQAILNKALMQFHSEYQEPCQMAEAIRLLRKVNTRISKVNQFQRTTGVMGDRGAPMAGMMSVGSVGSMSSGGGEMAPMMTTMSSYVSGGPDEDFRDVDAGMSMQMIREQVARFLTDSADDQLRGANIVARLRMEVRALRTVLQDGIDPAGILAIMDQSLPAAPDSCNPKPGMTLAPKKTTRLASTEKEPMGGDDDPPDGIAAALLPRPQSNLDRRGAPTSFGVSPWSNDNRGNQQPQLGQYASLLQRHNLLDDQDQNRDLPADAFYPDNGGGAAAFSFNRDMQAVGTENPADDFNQSARRNEDEFTSFREAQQQIRVALNRRREVDA
jgi:hypothetical protein